MSNPLSVKLPASLQSQLEDFSLKNKQSKGSLIRDALMLYFSSNHIDTVKIEQITQDVLHHKKPKHKINWQRILEKCRIDTKLSPEEEVRRGSGERAGSAGARCPGGGTGSVGGRVDRTIAAGRSCVAVTGGRATGHTGAYAGHFGADRGVARSDG